MTTGYYSLVKGRSELYSTSVAAAPHEALATAAQKPEPLAGAREFYAGFVRIFASARMQPVFQAATLHALKPVSRDRWLDPVAALYPKFLFEDVDDSTVLQPARQQLIELYGTDAIIKLRTPAPECFALDALHVRPGPVQGPNLHNHAVILCPGANGYYEDSFTFMFVQVIFSVFPQIFGYFGDLCLLISLFAQWVRHHVGDVHIIAANYAGTYRRCSGVFAPAFDDSLLCCCFELM
jgi:hypothetical protein